MAVVIFAVFFVLSTWGLWLLARTVREIAAGEIRTIIARGPRSYGLASSPGFFVLTAVAWLVVALSLAGGGALLIALFDPASLLLPPAAVAAAHGIALGLRAAGGRSGDDGEGSVLALDAGDPAALAARIDVLPVGAERRMLEAVLASGWSQPVSAVGYRERGERGARARREAILSAAAHERRRAVPAALLGATGVIPCAALRLLAPPPAWADLSALAAAITATMALGAVVIMLVARRRVAVLAERLAGPARR